MVVSSDSMSTWWCWMFQVASPDNNNHTISCLLTSNNCNKKAIIVSFSSSEKKLCCSRYFALRRQRSSLVVQSYILYSSLKLNDAAVKASMKQENVAINIMLVRNLVREIQTFVVKFWIWVFPSCTSEHQMRSCDLLPPTSPPLDLIPVNLHTLLGVGAH